MNLKQVWKKFACSNILFNTDSLDTSLNSFLKSYWRKYINSLISVIAANEFSRIPVLLI